MGKRRRQKTRHVMIKTRENPALDAWVKRNTKLVDKCVDEVYFNDPTSYTWTSFSVHTAGDYLWLQCGGEDVRWERFDVDAWLTAFRSNPAWTEQLEEMVLPTVLAFFTFLNVHNHVPRDQAAAILCRLKARTNEMLGYPMFNVEPTRPENLPN